MCALALHERSFWRAVVPDTLQLFSDTTLCAILEALHTLLFGAQLRMTTKVTYCILSLHTLHQTMALLSLTYSSVDYSSTTPYSVFQ